jgi:hypothetical protein
MICRPMNMARVMCRLLTLVCAVTSLSCGRSGGRFSKDVSTAEAAPVSGVGGSAGGGKSDGGNPSPPAARAADPTKPAKDWIKALGARDPDSLAKRSRFPFALRDTGAEGKCKSATIDAADKLAVGTQCLLKDDLLNEDLKANPEPTADVLSAKTLPRWSRKWAKEIPAGATPVSIFLPGNGSSFDLVLLVSGDGVQGFWKHATFEPN